MKDYIKEAVRSLRKNATPAECKFWQNVRNKKIDGIRFYRQFPIEFEIDGRKRFFIADFYCKQHKLVVEIDGGIHELQPEYDAYRSLIIEQLGLRVIRFTNDEVRFESDKVIEKLKDNLTP